MPYIMYYTYNIMIRTKFSSDFTWSYTCARRQHPYEILNFSHSIMYTGHVETI